MSSKVRVHDLAKKYGLSGKELAAKLRDLGFAKVKSHMTALDEFEALQAEGRLEANGILPVEAPTGESENLGGGLVIRRKKKKLPEEGAAAPAPPAAPPAAEPEEAPAVAAASEESQPEEVAPAATSAPAETPAEAPVETAAEPVADAPPAAEEAPAPSAPAEVRAETAEASEVAAPAEPAEPAEHGAAQPAAVEPAEPAPVAEAQPEPSGAAAEAASKEAPETAAAPAPEAATPEAAAAPAATEATADAAAKPAEAADPAVVRPGAKRRAGKVVGFIDLSKIQPATPARKTQSRRLKSSDDTAPNVLPTRGRSRTSALQRGDNASRGELTAGQLREREAGRFLRRRGPITRGGPGGGRRSGGVGSGLRGGGPSGSPHAGTTVKIEEPLTVRKIAEAMAIKANDLLRRAFKLLGFGAVQINSSIDRDTAELLAHEYDVELDIVRTIEAEEALLEKLSKQRSSIEEEHLAMRAPTVAFMGHVDHGKTTLLDALRNARKNVTAGEAGGITQHIGAYQVTTAAGHTVTVLDTPGHQAFSAMRARGAAAVDVAVLVIAADDGVMPQTEEAANHAKAAGVPIIIALNKMDKPDANPERVKQQLMGLELVPEEYGGQTAIVPVSALKGEGLEQLIERVFLEGEMLELQSHPEGPATGIVLEAEKQEGKGIVAHLLVQDGSLKRGDVILAGEGYGKVRAMINDQGEMIESAGPSVPVQVTGLSELPGIGEHFHIVADLSTAKVVAEERAHKNRMVSLAERGKKLNRNIFEAVTKAEKKTIDLILKADVQGTLQALREQLGQLVHDEVDVRILHSGVGTVSESDVALAVPADATILTFHTNVSGAARQEAERSAVPILSYEVIYELLDTVKMMMEGSLAPEIREELTGHAEVKRVFPSSRFGNIAGCMVLDGRIARSHHVRVMRDGKVVHQGRLSSIRREAEEVKEIREGFECGMLVKDFNGIEVGDILETFKLVEVKRLLEI